MSIEENDVLKAITLLQRQQGEYSVTKLASLLGVNRSDLYKNFSHLIIKDNTTPSEDEVFQILWQLKEYKEENKVGQDEISEKLGISRQTFVNRYPLSKALCAAKARFPQHVKESVDVQDMRIADLESEIARLRESYQKERDVFEKNVYSSLMRNDRQIFDVKKLSQDSEASHRELLLLKESNEDVFKENIALKADLSKFQRQGVRGNCENLGIFNPEYSKLDQNESNIKTLLASLLTIEKAMLKDVTRLADKFDPDWVVLVQSSFLDVGNFLDFLPVSGTVIVIESNYFGRNEFKKYFGDLKSKLLGIIVETSVSRSKLSIRNRRLGMIEKLIDSVSEGCVKYKLQDGFDRVLFTGDSGHG